MSQGLRTTARTTLRAVAAVVAGLAPHVSGWAADIDIYGPPGPGGASNVVFLLDNTSNWSANNQAWSKASVDAKCNALTVPAQKATCLNYSTQIFGGFTGLEQGRVQLRALKLVLNELVCSGNNNALKVNVGLSLLGKQSVLNNGHGVGIINFAVQPLTGTATLDGSSCKAIIDRLNLIDGKVTDPDWKADSSANYSAPYYEIFKYFGGHSNPTLAGNPAPNPAAPIGPYGYGPQRYSLPNPLDDTPTVTTDGTYSAYTDGGKLTYKSPISAANSCAGNYIVLVGNTYPNQEPNSGNPKPPVVFTGLNYTPPTLSAITSDTSRFSDEWSYFLANTDVSLEGGVQRIFSYTVNTYNAQPDAGQTKLLKSMAAVGGVGPSGYLEVGGDLYALINAFKDILINISAVNSVFTATTLPVSTTTQGTFLNQIFVGMFRPDANASPRWVGNLKQYQLGLINGTLSLVDKNNNAAVLSAAGFFRPTAQSFWTEDSVFFDQLPSGTPALANDNPDGSIVEKGGAAQQLRKANLQAASGRNVKTLSGGALAPFDTANSGLSAAMVAWARGENNVAAGAVGDESFIGSYSNSGITTLLGATGARHSMHGDVLHSRPVALNYGTGGVVVYYGGNDGFFRAVDGNKTGGTSGQELWSFIPPELYPLLTRQRDGTPTLHLPETNSSGATVAAPAGTATKAYGMDGPIGVYARYSSPSVIDKAYVYATMRRGGRSVYAFNVSTPGTPALLWSRTGGTAPYAQLAQTWSMPKAVVTKSAGVEVPILIMGGGYDAAEDSNSTSGIGNRIYIVNGLNGDLVKEFTTDFSVPSDVTVVDTDGDGNPDRAYVADVRGNVYRIDFPASGSLSDSATWGSTLATKIAEVGGKVFYAPDVVVTKNFIAVLVGTGDREKPLLNSTTDKFVLIKDNVGAPRGAPLTVAAGHFTRVAKIDNLTMAPTLTASGVNDPEGCYLELATNGEKVVNAPFSIAGATYFGTNRPKPVNATSCSADLGEAYAYKFPLFCGVPTTPSLLAGGGLPPSPVGGIVTIDVNGVPTQMPFLIGGTGPSAFDVSEPKPPVPPIRTRQNWRIDNTNR